MCRASLQHGSAAPEKKLDRDIAHSLEGVQSTPVSPQEKSYGKLQRYEVGTVASILVQNKRAYLVAVATMNAYKAAQATRQDVQDALPRPLGVHPNAGES